MFKSKKTALEAQSYKWTFGIMLGFGIVGLIASFVLAVEEFHLLKDPAATLSCSFNLVLNCSTVMQTWQATVFGFPNMFIGLMAFPVVIVVAALGLAKTSLPRWFYVYANVGYLLGAIFAYWLFFNSLYDIQVLCPWCLIVTFSTTLLLASITSYNLRENQFHLSKKINKHVQMFLDKDFHKVIVAGWIVLMLALVFLQFGDALFA
jgi:uncharacterized membrane protein